MLADSRASKCGVRRDWPTAARAPPPPGDELRDHAPCQVAIARADHHSALTLPI